MRTFPFIFLWPLLLVGFAQEPSDALKRAGENRPQIEKALADVPAAQKAGLEFLVRHMPERDLKTLSAAYLLDNVAYAAKARAAVPWGKDLPDELYFNDVLPYASINERRDNWRKDFYQRFLPLVKDAKTPGEAAQILNRDMWKIVNVKYHARKRPKPDQSPYESMEATYASCTGLSVLLIDACRSVCVPARFVGTPAWSNKRGNHSWVEVWNGEQWSFTGACEYNKGGLNRGWFAGDASRAQRDEPMHAIYASSWKPADRSFPLIWNLKIDYVAGVNVTDRYARPDDQRARTFIQVFDGEQRVSRYVRVLHGDKQIARGMTRGEKHDSNDMLTLQLEPGKDYTLEITQPDKTTRKKTFTPAKKDEEIRIQL